MFYYSSLIQEEYRQRHNGEENTVRGNDVAFAVHALVLCCIILSQFWSWLWGFDKGGRRGGGARVGNVIWGIVGGSLLYVAWVMTNVLRDGGAGTWQWIDFVSLSAAENLATRWKDEQPFTQIL